MAERPPTMPLLPRLARGQTRAAVVWNAAGLLATALVGTGMVHLLAYHVPLTTPFSAHWVAAAVALLAACPLVRPLGGGAAVIAVLVMLLALWEVQRLERLNKGLGRLLAAHRLPLPSPQAQEAVPRSSGRLAIFVGVVLGLQVTLLGVLEALYPMRASMVMHGVPMTMVMPPTLPLAPLHLGVAVLLGLLLWRVERRLTRLHAQIAQRRRLLAHRGSATPILPALSRPAHLPRAPYGHALFARPPPAPTSPRP